MGGGIPGLRGGIDSPARLEIKGLYVWSVGRAARDAYVAHQFQKPCLALEGSAQSTCELHPCHVFCNIQPYDFVHCHSKVIVERGIGGGDGMATGAVFLHRDPGDAGR